MKEHQAEPTRTNSIPWRCPRWLAYGLSVVLPLAVVFFRLEMGISSGEETVLNLFLIPIILCAYLGGLGPGLVATAVSAVASDYYLLSPAHSLLIGNNLQQLEWWLMIVSGAFVSVLIEVLQRSKERAQASEVLQKVTLASIGDGVITTDNRGRITFLNREAEQLTGWSNAEAAGRPLPLIFHIVNERSKEPVEDPVKKVLRSGTVVGLANHTVLIRRDGLEIPIDDSGAPIRQPNGTIIGVVLVFRDCVETKKAEAATRERLKLREQLAKIVDTVPGVIYSFRQRPDGSSCLPYVSPAAAEIFGLRPEDVANDSAPLFALMHPDDAVRVKQTLAESGRQLRPWHDEFRLRHPQRGDRWIEGHAVPQREPDGGVLWHGFADDFTARKQAEEDLRRSEARFRSLFENMLEGFAYCRMIFEQGRPVDFVYLKVNDAFAKLTGLKDVVGKRVSEVIPGIRETSPELFEIYGRTATTGEPCQFESNVKALGIWFSIAVYCPEKEHFIAIFENISKRKQVEAAWQESRALYHSLVEQMPVGVFRKNAEGRFSFVNSHFCRMHGLNPEDYLGKKPGELPITDPAFKSRAEEHHAIIMQSGRQIEVDEAHRRSDGTVAHFHAIKSPVFNSEGKITSTQGVLFDITERRNVETALHQSEERLRLAQSAGHIGIFDVDLTRDYATWTEEEEAIFGFAPGTFDHTSATFWQLLHPEDRERVERLAVEAIANRSELNTEYRFHRHGNHALRWARVRGKAVYDEEGRAVRMVGVNVDITEDKQAEAALLESRSLYHSLVEQIPAGIFRKDAEGHYVFVNDLFCRLKGMKAEDFLGKTALEVAASEPAGHSAAGLATKYARRGEEVYKLILQTGISVEEEEEYTNPDGGKQIMHVVRLPLRGPDGKIIGTQGILFDVTQMKQAEELNRRLATAVQQAAEEILITDASGKILYANPAFESISGYTRQEVIGLNPRFLKSGKHDAAFYQKMWQTLLRGDVWSGRIINKKKDGTLIEEEASISPIRDGEGRTVNYVAVRRDVTREVALEAQLRQSQKMDAVGQLAGGVAHDFNNLLTVIRGNVALLQMQDPEFAERTSGLVEIAKAAERATSLTRQLLQFSRQQSIQARDLDLNEVVTHFSRMLQRVLGEDIQMQLNFAPRSLFVHADPGMMDQILMNLAVNSRDAMPNGGRLIIETSAATFDEAAAAQSSQARPGAFACLTVTDTGCGIPSEVLPRIFDPFFTTKDVGKGTGLGLATVFGIVQQHDGWITAYSKVGSGTTFRIHLPRIEKLHAPATAAGAASMRGGSETILLVEDEAPVRRLVQKLLMRLGYRVLEAGDGLSALELWRQNKNDIHLLLTDLIMPGGLTGRRLAEQLVQQNPQLKVIYTSGYSADVADCDFPLTEGVNFVSKPFETQKLVQAIRSMLDSEKKS